MTDPIHAAAPVRWLNLMLRDSQGGPLADRPYTLTWPDGGTLEGATESDGLLRVAVPDGITWADLNVAWRQFRLRLDALEPVHTVAGAQARLNHLNFHAGAIDGDAGPKTRGAVEAFQRTMKLPVTGELDRDTQARLQAQYGR